MSADPILELASSIADGDDPDLAPLRDALPDDKRPLLDAFQVLQKIRRLHSQSTETGTLISGRYRLEEEIGSGGMGRVFRAHDLTLRRTVALKLMRARIDRQPRSRDRFMREARAAAALEHPAIAPIYDAGESDDGARYIAMAFYEAESLRDRLARGPIPAGRAIAIAATLAEALAYAHSHGVVHRDLKPGNILLTPEGEVKLIDFGVAKHDASTALTRSGAMVGTPLYMAPEQITGGEVDGRADIWALCAVLFEMVSGQRPFEAEGTEGIVYAIVHGEIPELTASGDAESRLRAIVSRGLARDPDDRFASAGELAAQLRNLVEEFPEEAATEIRSRVRPAANRLRTLIPWTVLLLVALAAAWLWFANRQTEPEPVYGGSAVAVLPFENLTGDEQLSYVGSGLAAGLISQLSQLADVSVVSRARVWSAAAAGADPSVIGKELGTNLIVTGEVHAQRNEFVVDVTATDAGTGAVLWSSRFPGSPEDLVKLQGEMVIALSRVLAAPLTAAHRRRLGRDAPSAKAFDYYLQGIELLEDPSHPNNVERASELLSQAIRLDDQAAVFYSALSTAVSLQSRSGLARPDPREAERLARKAIDLEPGLPESYIALARALRDQGRYAESIAELRPLLLRNVNADEVFRELAYGYQRAGESESALECLETATTLGSENWFNWNALGKFQILHGMGERGEAALEKAIQLAPESAIWPRLNLAGMRLIKGELDQAIELLIATGATTTNAEVASNLATAHFFHGDLKRAEELYRVAVELDPTNHSLRRNLGDALVEQGRETDALEHFREAQRLIEQQLATGERTLEALSFRALYAAKSAHCDTAVATSGELTDLLRDNWQHHLNVAMALALCDRPTAAIAASRRAVDHGFPAAALAQQSELASLRSESEFVRLVSRNEP